MNIGRQPISFQLAWWGPITGLYLLIASRRIECSVFSLKFLNILFLVILLFLFFTEKDTKGADDDIKDIQYQHLMSSRYNTLDLDVVNNDVDNESWKSKKITTYWIMINIYIKFYNFLIIYFFMFYLL